MGRKIKYSPAVRRPEPPLPEKTTMHLKDIKATIDKPVYVNMTDPSLVKGAHMFVSNLKWDGNRLWRAVHNTFYTKHGWNRLTDVTPDEASNDRWEVLPTGPIPLEEGEF